MTQIKQVSFHVDIDSPWVLLKFWGLSGEVYSLDDLADFYEIAMTRALAMFNKLDIKATFFCVGRELEEIETARKYIKQAFQEGHEIACHTYSHPFAFTSLSNKEIETEIIKCSDIIDDIIGERPVGFRSPGYDIDKRVIDILEQTGFLYDSSAFWSVFNSLFGIYYRWFSKINSSGLFGNSTRKIPSEPYFPSVENWRREGAKRNIIELPLPRLPILNFPFYNNLYLKAGPIYRGIAPKLVRNSYLLYLLHLIEFVDLSDRVPSILQIHPNLAMNINKKTSIMCNVINLLKQKYETVRTDIYVENYQSEIH